MIANTDEKDSPGQHWVAFYFTKDGVCEFFDSYGRTPWQNYLPWFRFIHLNSVDLLSNTTCFQAPTSVTCGAHCIFYLRERCKGFSMCDIKNMYSKNVKYNDLLVVEYLKNVIYDVSVDVDCDCNQSCKPQCMC